MDETPYRSGPAIEGEVKVQNAHGQVLRRLSQLLWFSPALVVPIVFAYVIYTFVVYSGGTLYSGLRRFGSFLPIIIAFSFTAWGVALTIAARLDGGRLSQARAWGIAFALVSVIAMTYWWYQQ